MKNLANCNPIEFMQQTYKIAKRVKELNAETHFLDIRKHQPDLTGKETEKEKKEAMSKQGQKNLWDMYECLMENSPREAAEILGLMCFIEPEEIENYKGLNFMSDAIELLKSKEVNDFFLSLTN